jgi:hypothetical protein
VPGGGGVQKVAGRPQNRAVRRLTPLRDSRLRRV